MGKLADYAASKQLDEESALVELVERTGSVDAAARELGVYPNTIGYALKVRHLHIEKTVSTKVVKRNESISAG